MIIIIDGYNFLKSITGTKFISECQMRYWINYFEKYIYYRGNQVIVALDAGPYLFASSESHGAVDVWYAGQHQTADDWIKAWLTKNRHKDILLVTSDRQVRDCAENLGIVSISSQDFYKILQTVVEGQEHQEEMWLQSLHKTKNNEPNDAYLDNLMDQGSRNIVSIYKENEYTHPIDRTSQNKQKSKSDKAFLRKINKV